VGPHAAGDNGQAEERLDARIGRLVVAGLQVELARTLLSSTFIPSRLYRAYRPARRQTPGGHFDWLGRGQVQVRQRDGVLAGELRGACKDAGEVERGLAQSVGLNVVVDVADAQCVSAGAG
jgi:hypothetical protein